MNKTVITASILLGATSIFAQQNVTLQPYAEAKARAAEIVSQLTEGEKIDIIGGRVSFGYSAVKKAGFREISYADASLGLKKSKGATRFSSSIGLAASMNRELASVFGRAMGEECRHYGVDYLLGPGVNLYRVHQGGRNFEYMGADPYLAGALATSYINGAQSTGTGVSLKHFVANNCEYARCNSDSVMSERTLRELYLTPFRMAVKDADPLSIMTSYNLINGEWAGENKLIMTDIARGEWDYQGFFVSDWGSIYDAKRAFDSGLDQEAPAGGHFNQKGLVEVLKAPAAKAELDRKVIAMLTSSIRAGMYDADRGESRDDWAKHHSEEAIRIVDETTVLLKNENALLPLDPTKELKVAIVGANMYATTCAGSGAGGFGNSFTNISIAEAIAQALPHAKIITPIKGADKANKRSSGTVLSYQAKATEFAAAADVVIVGIGSNIWVEGERKDRPFKLEPEQYQLIEDVLSVNKKVIVINVSGTGIDMAPFAEKVPAIIQAFYGGEEGGGAVARVISGQVNPSGKLPFTLGKKAEDHHWFGNYLPESVDLRVPVTFKQKNSPKWQCQYSEGILLDYRWFDTKDIEPLYPFGHGLSYTTFEVSGITIEKKPNAPAAVSVTVKVTNTGDRDGAEVIQVYVEDVACSEMRPLKEFKQFDKVFLKKGESKLVKLELDETSFAFWSEKIKDWTVEPGVFKIHVGNSSRNILQSAEVMID